VSDITPEKTHALLEKLAEYVMNEVPTRREMNSRFRQVEEKLDKIEQGKADKHDIQRILDGMDAQAKQLDIIRTEQAATNAALLRHEKRITALEEKDTGYRVRDKMETQKTALVCGAGGFIGAHLVNPVKREGH